MRVVFLGSQAIGADCLEVVLNDGHDVVGVATFSPETHESWANEVETLASLARLPRLQARRFRVAQEIEAMETLRPDLVLVVGWRWILPTEVLNIPKLGVVGVHGSLLPRLRGFAPVNWALIRGERETGPTLFYIDEGMDTGDVIGQRKFAITQADDASTVRARMTRESAALLAEFLPQIAAGTAPRVQQDHRHATVGERRKPSDGQIDWSASPGEVVNLVRGLTRPYPGAFTSLGGRVWTIWRARELSPEPRLAPGTIWSFTDQGEPRVVAASGGLVEILDLEPRP